MAELNVRIFAGSLHYKAFVTEGVCKNYVASGVCKLGSGGVASVCFAYVGLYKNLIVLKT